MSTNLDAERFRLVFVSDRIPSSLRRIIEFLNEHTTNIDVLGIEVSQYTDNAGGQQIIVPRFVGETEAAKQTKGRRGRRAPIDRDELLGSFGNDTEAAAAAAGLLDAARERPDLDVRWSAAGDIVPAGRRLTLLRIWCAGRFPDGRELEVRLRSLQDADSSTWDAERCDQLIQRLEARADLHFNQDRRWPRAPIAPLADPRKRQAFLEVIGEVAQSLNPLI